LFVLFALFALFVVFVCEREDGIFPGYNFESIRDNVWRDMSEARRGVALAGREFVLVGRRLWV
jgi:gamma-glutamylcysteine synthetase